VTLNVVRRGAPAEGGLELSGGVAPTLHPVLRRVYAARGIRSAGELELGLDRLLPVGTLAGVEAAVDLLLGCRESGAGILVIGDFDADGATSTALIVRALTAWGFPAVDFLVPNRFQFGYGLTPGIVGLAAQRAPGLIVTVDNGISSIEGVAAARLLGIAVLVTDHHLPGAVLPDADVIVNPNLPGSGFQSTALAGVGVAFYLMAALKRRLDALGSTPPGAPGPAEFLDLVALGTVADVVPLDTNNRVLVAQGLKRIRAGRCSPGIRALLAVAGRRLAGITAADLGFAVAPRLNAAGRLDDMSEGIRCLLADSDAAAAPLAARLDQLNRERRDIEARMQAQALAAVRGLRDPDLLAAARGEAAAPRTRAGICLYDPGWHQGVVGLVASRVKEKLRRPVIAFAQAEDGWLRGSARSMPGIHVRDVLENIAARNPELISKFGGHAMAAGLTLAASGLDRFALEFEREVGRCAARAGDPNLIETDGELEVEEMALETAAALREGGPWGQAFPEPLFDGVFEVRSLRVVGEKHLKMWVEVPGSGRSFDAIAFNLLEPRGLDPTGREPAPALPVAAASQVRLVYRLDVNEYQGERRLQLLVDHVLALPPSS
jgi:single-stranded-DNA-specific exonuclease